MNTEENESRGSLLARLFRVLSRKPASRDDLIELLRDSGERELVDSEVLSIIERALQVADMQVREIMIPKSQVTMLQVDMPVEEILQQVLESGYSRFPVTGEDSDEVVGILLAKELLVLARSDGRRFNVKERLRPTYAVPGSKRVNVLLQEFRGSRNHLAIVYDEYGGVAGIVTIEDVLEQLVGDIHDEFDLEDEDNIKAHADDTFIVKALTDLTDFNSYFSCDLAAEDATVGGLVLRSFGYLPQRDEEIQIGGFSFRVLSSDARRIHRLLVTRVSASETPADR